MSKYFSISGYWKDDTEDIFEDYIVKEFSDSEKNEAFDDLIFYYGLSEEDIKECIANPNDKNCLDFVITDYEETTLI